jgi:hypothetical protein
MKEYSTGSLTTYDVENQEDELLKFSSAYITTKVIIKCSMLWKPGLKQHDMVLYKWFMIKCSRVHLFPN